MSNRVLTINYQCSFDTMIRVPMLSKWETEEKRMAQFKQNAQQSLKSAVYCCLTNNPLFLTLFRLGLIQVPNKFTFVSDVVIAEVENPDPAPDRATLIKKILASKAVL